MAFIEHNGLTLPIVRICLMNPIQSYNEIPVFSIPWYGKLFSFRVSNGELLSCKEFVWVDKTYSNTIEVAETGFSRVRDGHLEQFKLGLSGITMPTEEQLRCWVFDGYGGKMYVRFGPSNSMGMLEMPYNGNIRCHCGKWVKDNFSRKFNNNVYNSYRVIGLNEQEFAKWLEKFTHRILNDNANCARYDIMEN